MDQQVAQLAIKAVNGLSKLPQEENRKEKEEATEGKVPNVAPLLKQVEKAKKGYATTARWMLGAFGAVGLLLFGSLPFSNVGDVKRNDRWQMGIGLGAAALGISLAVWSASLVFEPLDASLGSLAKRLQSVQDKNGNTKSGRRFLGPRHRSAVTLSEMLTGQERSSHLGPGMTSISKLIEQLGDLEAKYLEKDVEVAKCRAHLKSIDEVIAGYQNLASVGKSSPCPGEGEFKDYVKQRAELTINGMDCAGELASVEAKLAVYRSRRQLLLIESAFMQMRGNFHLARWMMSFGSLITLGGGALYASVLPN